jgi:NADH dehydrogenase FAD-containing subunit
MATIFVSDDDGKSKIHSSVTIWTAGIKGYDIPINPEVKKKMQK